MKLNPQTISFERMSVHVYQSERVEKLAAHFVEQLKQELKRSRLGRSIIVLVPNKAMQSWLSVKITEKLGVCMNIQFQLPFQFLFDRIRQLPEFKALPELTASSREGMEWMLFHLFLTSKHEMPKMESKFQNEWDVLAAYLSHSQNQSSLLNLASSIAQVFDAYQIYRPELVASWEADSSTNDWQGVLWNRIKSISGKDFGARSELFEHLERALRSTKVQDDRTIFFFGQPSVPPRFVEILALMSEKAFNDLHIYWPFIQLSQESPSFLKDWCFQQEDTLRLWNEKTSNTLEIVRIDEAVERPKINSVNVLNRLRRNDKSTNVTDSGFPSFKVHACHSKLREVEICRNNLLHYFDLHAELNPSDVLILAPDIQEYVPLIRSVFNQALPIESKENSFRSGIPFKLRDLRYSEQFRQAILLKEYLSQLSNVLTKDALIGLLQYEGIQKAYDLNVKSVQILEQLFDEGNFRAALDQEQLAKYGYNYPSLTTLKDLLRKYLAGLFIDTESLSNKHLNVLPNGLSPLDMGSGSEALKNLNGLVRLFSDLEKDTKATQSHKGLSEWTDFLSDIVQRLFDSGGTDQHKGAQEMVIQLRKIEHILSDHLTKQNSWAYLHFKNWVFGQLDKTVESPGFYSGSVTIASMVPMRSIPHKFIYVLGMDQNTFPREIDQPFFDRISQHPENRKVGDRDRVKDDLQLFADLIFSAENALHISYSGMSQSSDAEYTPSPVVTECMEYLKLNGVQDVLKKYAIHAYSRSSFNEANSPSFDEKNYELALSIAESNTRNDNLSLGQIKLNELLQESQKVSEETDTIDLDDLILFFTDPAKFWFERNQQIRIPQFGSEHSGGLLNQVNHLERYLLNQQVFSIREEQTYEALFAEWLKEGRIDNAPTLLKFKNEFGRNAKQLTTFFELNEIKRVACLNESIVLDVEGFKLRYSPKLYWWGGQKIAINYYPSKLKGKRVIRPWIESHFLSLMDDLNGQQKVGLMLTMDKEDLKITLFKNHKDEAVKMLAKLIHHYQMAKEKPLLFNPTCAFAGFDKKWEWTEKGAKAAWYNGYNTTGEEDKVYNRWLWGADFPFNDEAEVIAYEVFGNLSKFMKEVEVSVEVSR